MSFRKAATLFSGTALLFGLGVASAQAPSSMCTELLERGDATAVAACKAQLDEAESGPATEHMARIVADDEYGLALLAIAHQPKQALAPFDRGIALLPEFLCRQGLATGRLTLVLPEWTLAPAAILYAVYAATLEADTRVQRFVEFLAANIVPALASARPSGAFSTPRPP